MQQPGKGLLRMWGKRTAPSHPWWGPSGASEGGETDLLSREVLVLLCSWLCGMGEDEGKIFLAFTLLQKKNDKRKRYGRRFTGKECRCMFRSCTD